MRPLNGYPRSQRQCQKTASRHHVPGKERPLLLSTFATEGDETVPAPVHILNDVGLHDAELTPELEQPGRQWASTCDSVGLDGETTYPDPDSETLFSLYLRSPSPTRTSVGELSGCSSDTAVDPGLEILCKTRPFTDGTLEAGRLLNSVLESK